MFARLSMLLTSALFVSTVGAQTPAPPAAK